MTTAAPTALFALGALAALVIAVIVLRAMPRGGFIAWTLVLFLVPIWVGVTAGPHWPAIVLLTVVLLIANWSRVPLHPADGLMAGFGGMVLVLLALGEVELGAALTVVLEWMIPYIWGRVVLARVSASWVSSAIAVVAVIAGILAIIEFATSFNLFILIPGPDPLYSSWNTLQTRGGVLRAEGAFGHSIALGAALAMSTAFAIDARWRTIPKVLAIAVIATATVLTFSRAGQITMVLTLVASITLLPGLSRRFRITVIALGALGAGIALPIVESVLGAAGGEAVGSAGYRTDLLVLLQQVELIGNAGDWQALVAGDFYLGFFADSVDNALVLALLRYGLVPTLLMAAAIIWPALAVLRRQQRNPAALAVAGQLPSLVVVALITQYGVFLWFCVGLAVTWGAVAVRDDPGRNWAGQPSTRRPDRAPQSASDR